MRPTFLELCRQHLREVIGILLYMFIITLGAIIILHGNDRGASASLFFAPRYQLFIRCQFFFEMPVPLLEVSDTLVHVAVRSQLYS